MKRSRPLQGTSRRFPVADRPPPCQVGWHGAARPDGGRVSTGERPRRPGVLRGSLPALLALAVACAFPAHLPGVEEEIRPFDAVYLKVSPNDPIVGTIQGVWDPSATSELVIKTKGGATSRIGADRIDRVIPRQTADEVYAKKLSTVGKEHDAERRARAELDLGIWCKTPLGVLGGKPPEPDKALAHVFNAVDLSPGLQEAYPHLMDLLDSAAGEDGHPAYDARQEVRMALVARLGKVLDPEIDFRLGVVLATRLDLPSRALPVLERFLASRSTNAGERRRAREILRDIYLKESAPEKAVAMYQAAIAEPESRPENFEPFYEIARIEARRGRFSGPGAAEWEARVRGYFEKARACQPDFPGIAAELASLDYRKGDLPAAEKLLRGLLASESANASARIDLALVLRRAGKREEAEAALKEAEPLLEGPEEARLHIARGALLEDSEDVRGASAQYRLAVATDPTSTEAKVLLGLSLARLGESAEARKIGDGMLAASQGNPAVFSAACRIRAEAELADGKPEAALEQLERAVGIDRDDATLLERTGIVRVRLGRLEGAYEMLRRAVEAGGERPATLDALAYYHYKRGETKVARALFEQVIRLVPPPPKVAQGPPQPVPPARAYALQGRDLIDDLTRLLVWTADFSGEDASALGGWDEIERYGIEISRRGSLVVLAGKQSGAEDGVTSAMLTRAVDGPSFERLSARMRVDSGRVRPALRLDDYAPKGNIVPGVVLFRDLDGVLRVQVRTTQGANVIEPTDDLPPDGGKLVYLGKAVWPDDHAFHTLEIRRAAAGRATTARASLALDFYFDGDPIAWNVKVGGIGARSLKVGFSGQTDGLDNEYSLSVESFKVYRERPRGPDAATRR